MIGTKIFLREKIVSFISSIIPITILGSLTRTKLIIPYYHIISDEKVLHIYHLYKYKNKNQFIKDIDFIQKNYHPISLYDLLHSLRNGSTLTKNSFLLTFA